MIKFHYVAIYGNVCKNYNCKRFFQFMLIIWDGLTNKPYIIFVGAVIF